MKSLNNIIENFFSNVGARLMTLREFMINLLNHDVKRLFNEEKHAENLTDSKLVVSFLDWMHHDDVFNSSRKIKGVNIHKFLLNNIDKPITINANIVPSPLKMPNTKYVYNLNVDGEEFIWFRYELYPWVPNKHKKI